MDRFERILLSFYFGRKQRSEGKNTTRPSLGRTYPIELKFGMHKLEVLTQLSTRSTRARTSPQSRAISTGSDQVDPPTNSSAKQGISRFIYAIDSP